MTGEAPPEILQALRLLTEPGQVFEIRIINPAPVRYGYYNDPEKASKDIEILDAGSPAPGAIYLTINPCHPDLLHKREPNRIHMVRDRTDTTTNDAQIARRRWLYIDLDVEREVQGISSTDAEKKMALEKARELRDFLKEDMGFPDPLEADSGNGAHLLYRIDLPNDEKSSELVSGVLNALNQAFPATKDCPVNVDTTTANPARICKMYGTVARKGINSPERPHRRSHLLSPGSGEVVPVASLKAVADLFRESISQSPKEKKKRKSVDLKTWLDEHRDKLPTFTERSRPAYTYLVIFDDCPWGGDKSHKAFVGQLPSGAIVAKCHDYSCGGAGKGAPNRWHDLREQVEGKKIPKGEIEAKEKKPEVKCRAWGELAGQLFFTVRTRAGQYFFASFKDGALTFSETLTLPYGVVHPQPLPISRDGESIPIVGIPLRENMESSNGIAPEALFITLKDHLTRYIDVKSLDMEMIIHYILLTWFQGKVSTIPYLRLLGDTGKGKSRILDAVADLCFLPIIASGQSTSSGIMRYKELWHGTLRIDEADLKDGDTTHELIKYLNLGFERNRFFIKTDKMDPKQQEIFDPFCAKIIGMRQPFTDNATEGRVLSISPEETTRVDLPVLLPVNYSDEVDRLRGVLARFALEHWHEVKGDKMVDLSDEEIEARIKQLALPLSIVLQLFPDGEERFRIYIRERQMEVIRTRAASWEGQLFNTAVDLALGDADPPEGYSGYTDREGMLQAVTAAMLAKSMGTSPKDVNQAMKGIGFVVEMPHIIIGGQRKTARALKLESEKRWIEASKRYRIEQTEKGLAFSSCPSCLMGKHFGTHGTLGTLQGDTPPTTKNGDDPLSTKLSDMTPVQCVPSVPLDDQSMGGLSPLCVPSVPSVPLDQAEVVEYHGRKGYWRFIDDQWIFEQNRP
ncbi:MAG: hypothetical protein LUP99_05885 [Methanomicrobiales archaeon]|nr:hypothetical protein [Methanomicrobiales archaeon]